MSSTGRTAVEQDRELHAALVLALMSVSVAGASFVMGALIFVPLTLLCALVLPIVVRPRGLVAWVLGFLFSVALAGGLICVTASMYPALRRQDPFELDGEWLGYALVAMLLSSAAWAGVLLIRAPERRAHALRIALLVALAYPFTAVVYGLMAASGMPLSA